MGRRLPAARELVALRRRQPTSRGFANHPINVRLAIYFVFPATFFFLIRPNEEDHPNHKRDSAVDGPLDLPGHKASRQHIDSLEEPYAAEKDQDRAHDIQYDSHVPP